MSENLELRLMLLELEERTDELERVIRDLVVELTGRGSDIEIGARRFLYVSGLLACCALSVLVLLSLVLLIAVVVRAIV